MGNRTALYAGSFDPFTNGHLYIAEEASKLFDELIIGIGNNSSKERHTNIYDMRDAIREQFKGHKNVRVVIIDNLVADYCKKHGISYLVRGLRNVEDYLYEENIAKINAEINHELKTVYLRTDNDVISSSMVRELDNYGKDISWYIPDTVYKVMKG